MSPFNSIITALAIIAPLVNAAPLETRAAANPYGIDPTKPFTLTAEAADNSLSWQLNTYKVNATTVGLHAFSNDVANPDKPAPSNFTLVASHYGTQLHTTVAGTIYSSDAPKAKTLYTFHAGLDNEPFAGDLSFLGVYHGGDPEAGTQNIVTKANDLNLASFSVCPAKGGKLVLRYQGVAEGCIDVLLEAFAA